MDSYVTVVREELDVNSRKLIDACQRELDQGVQVERAKVLQEVIESRELYLMRRSGELEPLVEEQRQNASAMLAITITGLLFVSCLVAVVLAVILA